VIPAWYLLGVTVKRRYVKKHWVSCQMVAGPLPK
jgi:hypothetical protein